MCKVLPSAKTSSIFLGIYTCKSKTVHVMLEPLLLQKIGDTWWYMIPTITQRRCHVCQALTFATARFGQMVATSEGGRAYKLLKRHLMFFHRGHLARMKEPQKPSKDLITNPEFPKVFWTLMVGRWNFFLKWSLLRGYLFIWFSGGLGGFPWVLEFLSRKIPILTEVETTNYTPVNWNSNGKWTRIEDVFPVEHGDFPLLCQLTRG